MSAGYVCGRLHNTLNFSRLAARPPGRKRLYSANPQQRPAAVYHLVGVDESSVRDAAGLHARVGFLALYASKTPILTLTRRERTLLIAAGLYPQVDIFVFEDLYPIFPAIRFVDSAQQNFSFLTRRLREVQAMGINGGMIDHDSRRYFHRVASRLRFRSSLDACFAEAPMHAFQEVFRLSEERPGRKIVALDFNSMYAACLQGEFADPGALMHCQINQRYRPDRPLSPGLYRVVLTQPLNDFIRQHHGLQYAQLNKKLPFRFPDDSPVEALLHASEVAYYAPHFASLQVIEGVCSPQTIAHPLLKEAQRLYADRLNYRRQGNVPLEKRCKMQLATLYSAVKRRKVRRARFASLDDTLAFLVDRFNLHLPPGMSVARFLARIDDKTNFTLQLEPHIELTYPDYDAPGVLYSLFSQVIANARVRMMQLLERLHAFPQLALCYSNVDSVHVSVPAERLEAFLAWAAPLISPAMGSLKLETLADRGYWLDTGRYWLIADRQVVQFKNQGIHNAADPRPFQDGRSWYKIFEEAGYATPVKCRWTLPGLLSYRKPLAAPADPASLVFTRFELAEIADYPRMQDAIAAEIGRSSAIKVALFERISARYANAGDPPHSDFSAMPDALQHAPENCIGNPPGDLPAVGSGGR